LRNSFGRSRLRGCNALNCLWEWNSSDLSSEKLPELGPPDFDASMKTRASATTARLQRASSSSNSQSRSRRRRSKSGRKIAGVGHPRSPKPPSSSQQSVEMMGKKNIQWLSGLKPFIKAQFERGGLEYQQRLSGKEDLRVYHQGYASHLDWCPEDSLDRGKELCRPCNICGGKDGRHNEIKHRAYSWLSDV